MARSFREIAHNLADRLNTGESEMKSNVAVKGIFDPVKSYYLIFDAFVRKPAFLSKTSTELISICEDLACCCICADERFCRRYTKYVVLADEYADFFDKNKDYGKMFVEKFLENGLVFASTRIRDKFIQFERLMNKYEISQDFVSYTLRDLISFCIITIIAVEYSMEEVTVSNVESE
jgi:hypothetical protein